eukprot:837375-Prymnesium_polylepis.1
MRAGWRRACRLHGWRPARPSRERTPWRGVGAGRHTAALPHGSAPAVSARCACGTSASGGRPATRAQRWQPDG